MTTDHERAERAAYGRGVHDAEDAIAKLLGVHLFAAIDVTMTQRQVVQCCIDRIRALLDAKPPEAEATETSEGTRPCAECGHRDSSHSDRGCVACSCPGFAVLVAAPPSESRATAERAAGDVSDACGDCWGASEYVRARCMTCGGSGKAGAP